jgi:hypothetical protein
MTQVAFRPHHLTPKSPLHYVERGLYSPLFLHPVSMLPLAMAVQEKGLGVEG